MISFRKTLLAALTAIGAMGALGSAAQAQGGINGVATGNVNLRNIPSTQYGSRVLTTLYAGTQLNVYGCLSSWSWCEVQWNNWRGWVSSRYLQLYWQGTPYWVADYARAYQIPILSWTPPAYNPPAYRPPAYVPPGYTPPVYVPPPPRY